MWCICSIWYQGFSRIEVVLNLDPPETGFCCNQSSICINVACVWWRCRFHQILSRWWPYWKIQIIGNATMSLIIVQGVIIIEIISSNVHCLFIWSWGGRNRMFIKYYIFWILNFTFRPELRTWSTITKQIQPISVQKMLQPQNFCEKKLSTENNNSAQNLSRSLYWVETLHWRQILVKNLGNKDVTAEPVFVRPIHECLGDSPPQVISCVSHPSPSPDFHLLLV